MAYFKATLKFMGPLPERRSTLYECNSLVFVEWFKVATSGLQKFQQEVREQEDAVWNKKRVGLNFKMLIPSLELTCILIGG